MAVPDYQSLMLPLLRFAGEKKEETSTGEAVDALAKELNLTDEDLKEMLPSGIQFTFVNRVGWATTYMKKAGLLEATRRGYYQITPRGQELLKKQPKSINVKLLKQYPEFLEFQQLKGTRSGDKNPVPKETLILQQRHRQRHWRPHMKTYEMNWWLNCSVSSRKLRHRILNGS